MVKMLLKTKNVDYTEVNVDDQPEVRQQVIQMSGAMTVPVTVVEDETGNTDITIGWNPAKLSAAVAA
jgi:glutaredoxin